MSKLTFPYKSGPAFGECIAITPDVLWTRSPLPLSLDHVNCYLLRDGDGWAIVDTGMNWGKTRDNWEAVIAGPLQGAPITRVIATHQHPDHVGLAGWLCETYRARLFMSEAEYLSSRVFLTLGQAEPFWEVEDYFRRTCMSEKTLSGLKSFNTFTDSVYRMPAAYHRIANGQTLRIGDYDWLCINARGHSPEHVSLYCAELNLYISGDQVLARITSNVSVTSTKPDDSPLVDWYASHERIEKLVPDTVTVLPAHELPFKGLHRRLREVMAHHDERLARLLELCESPANAQALTWKLFDRELDDFQNYLAVGECLAHLHMLMEQGRIERLDQDGIYLYRSLIDEVSEPSHL